MANRKFAETYNSLRRALTSGFFFFFFCVCTFSPGAFVPVRTGPRVFCPAVMRWGSSVISVLFVVVVVVVVARLIFISILFVVIVGRNEGEAAGSQKCNMEAKEGRVDSAGTVIVVDTLAIQ